MELPETYGLDLSTLRAEIDALDSELLGLVRKRLALASAVARAKAAVGETGFGFRPAREIAIYRRLLLGIADPAEIEAITAIWRSLVATNLRRQGPLRVVAAEGACATLARVHYGDGASIEVVPAVEIVEAMGDDGFAVGLLPMLGVPPHGRWWRVLTPSSPKIVAAFPFTSNNPPEALLLARLEPEQAGHDTTIISFEVLPGSLEPVDHLSKHGLTARLMDRDEAIVLLALDGFFRLDHLPKELPNLRILGSYARI
jgi:chorismate mutase